MFVGLAQTGHRHTLNCLNRVSRDSMRVAISASDAFVAPYIAEMLGDSAVVVSDDALSDATSLDAMLTPCSAVIHINSRPVDTSVGRTDREAYISMREASRSILDAVDRHGVAVGDAAVVDDAMKQAREELRDEAIQKKLNALVEKGQLTQEQADENLDWIQSRPEGIPAMGKHFFGEMRRHKGSKGHVRSFGSRNYFKGTPSWGVIEKKLNAMVEDGDITQEEAEAELRALQAKEAEKAASP